jgi:hypothetical protein
MRKPDFETASTPEQDASALETFKRWYENEQLYGPDIDPEERHAMGIALAIKAVYHLGQSAGYAQGYTEGKAAAEKQEPRPAGKPEI